jgi:hypothetical protein
MKIDSNVFLKRNGLTGGINIISYGWTFCLTTLKYSLTYKIISQRFDNMTKPSYTHVLIPKSSHGVLKENAE